MIHEGVKKKSSDTVLKVAKQKSRQRHSRAPRWVSGTSTDKREEKRAHPAQQQDGQITSSCQALRSWLAALPAGALKPAKGGGWNWRGENSL